MPKQKTNFHAAPKVNNIPPHYDAAVPATSSPFNREHLVAIADELLEFVGSLDPTWAGRIDIVRNDMHLDPLQTAGSLMVRVLDAGHHTLLPSHPFFEPGYIPLSGPGECPVCHESFTPDYPNQPCCTKYECAMAYHKKPE